MFQQLSQEEFLALTKNQQHMVICNHLQEALRLMGLTRGTGSYSEIARRWQISITDLEKVYSYVSNWVGRELPKNEF